MGSSRRWAIFLIASTLFLFSQFYRASIAVISPQLMADVGLDAGGLSLMSAAFFYAFALTQIPIGIFLDRIGPRLTMTALSGVAVSGALIFAWGDSLEALVAGRVLLGIGMACNLMGAFKLLTLWFSPLQFATLSALVVSIGTVGNLTATTPLAILVGWIGWRLTFSVFAALNLLLAAAFFLVVRDRPKACPAAGAAPPPPSPRFFSGLARLFRDRDYWIISIGTFCRYGIFAAVQTLWAGPFLMTVMGRSALVAGNLIFLLNLGMILGGPVWGRLSDTLFRTRKGVIITGLVCLAADIGALAAMPSDAGTGILAALFFAFGFFASAGGIMYTHIKELMPLEMAGTAMTGINFFTMIGAAAFLQGMGGLMQTLYPEAVLSPAAFQAALGLCGVCLLGVAVLYGFTRDTLGS
ncbi:MAG: MFS transporter [Desulfobacterales bacterium]